MGYVQSGKTANFTGVLAKAIDVGYRLVIVLTGTTYLLRAQTQRRLDMELVGRENILGGIDENDPLATDGLDYQDEIDWIAGNFVQHGCLPRQAGHPNIHRLTTLRRLQEPQTGHHRTRLPTSGRRKADLRPGEPLRHRRARRRGEKHAGVLGKLVADLKRSAARIDDLPVLITDDASDQASVNTSNPKRWKEDQKQRTAINRLIAQLQRMLPRAQYVGYTAAPFANVFIDPSDAEGIFPSDFLVALPRTPGYMGSSDFHDIDSLLSPEQRTYENSNQLAHVRTVPTDPPDDDHGLLESLDAFVLTGAIKLYRQHHGAGTFTHHTMLEVRKQQSDQLTSDIAQDHENWLYRRQVKIIKSGTDPNSAAVDTGERNRPTCPRATLPADLRMFSLH